jgi:hypothetical protein
MSILLLSAISLAAVLLQRRFLCERAVAVVNFDRDRLALPVRADHQLLYETYQFGLDDFRLSRY